jgi:excisionase family DNA binding protein
MSLVDVQRRLITIDQAAERLGLSRRTVERKIEQGLIPALQLGGKGTAIRIDERELAEWLAERRTSTSAGTSMPVDTPAKRRVPGVSPAVEARQPAWETKGET